MRRWPPRRLRPGRKTICSRADLNSRLLARALRCAMEHQRLLGKLKHQAEALQSSETRLRILIDATPDPVVFKDGSGHWLEANAASLSLWQLDGVDYHGKTDADLAEFSPFYGDAFLNWAASDEAVWKLGVSSVGEETLPMPGGGFKTYEVIKVPFFHGGGQRQGLVVLGRDITQRNQAEQSLARERDLLQALMDNIPDTIYFKDTASRFTRVNLAQAQTLNVADPQEAIGKSDVDFFAGDFYRATFHDEQVLFSTGQPIIGKIEELRWPDGRRRWVSATKMPIRSQTGQVIGLVGLSRDITEIKQRERELEVIASVSAALRSAANRAEMLPIILDQVLSLLEATAASFVMYDPVTGELTTEMAQGTWQALTGSRLWPETSISAEVLARGKPYWIKDAATEPRLAALAPETQTRAQVCVPLVTQEHALGVLWAGRPSEFTDMEVTSTHGHRQYRG